MATDPTLIELARVQAERDAAHRMIDDQNQLIDELKQKLARKQREIDATLKCEIAALTADLARERRERAEMQLELGAARRELTKRVIERAKSSDHPTCVVELSCVDAIGVAESIRALATLGRIPMVAQPTYLRVAKAMRDAADEALGITKKPAPAAVEVVS